MSSKEHRLDSPWQGLHGPNLGVIIDLYEDYVNDPQSVDEEMRNLFEIWGSPLVDGESEVSGVHTSTAVKDELPIPSSTMMSKAVNAVKLADMIRTKGHLASNINPIQKNETTLLDLEQYDLTEHDLQQIPANLLCSDAPAHVKNGLDAINYLKDVYTKTIAFEFNHVQDQKEREWLLEMVESGKYIPSLSTEKRINLLKRLTQVEGFETFFHRTLVGQKRFSIEGLDMLVPMLDEAVREVVQDGTENVMIGMAHRGRLSTLTHTLGKP